MVEQMSVNSNGIIWLKLKCALTGNSADQYFCLCYIPPEDSKLYKYHNSELYNFDFFECLNSDIRHYSDCGEVYLTGDFNARTECRADFIENIR